MATTRLNRPRRTLRERAAPLRILPYKLGSQSAKMLANALTLLIGRKVWRGEAKRNKLNFNWGNKQGSLLPVVWVNGPEPVRVASNKILTFQALERAGVRHVPYTTSKEVAQTWLAEGSIVFARTPTGQSGSGITIVRPPARDLPTLPLYTKYVRKQKEFRVHVMRGEVIDVQQKRKRNGIDNGGLIRNLANGWIFAHENTVEPAELRPLGIAAVSALELDFGAVDIIWNERQNRCYVLEVNTAPGLSQTTCDKYAAAIVRNYAI